MGFIGELIDLASDSKHIAGQPPRRPGADRLAIWGADLRLRLLRVARRSEATILGHRIAYLDHGMLVQLFREIFVYRLYDVPLKPAAPRIIDCGSNIGMSIIFFKNLYPDAHITGFEPQPLVFQTLQGNVERNGLRDVVLHQKALSDTAGTIEFFVKAAEPGALNASLYAASGQTPIQVQADRLSTYIDR